FTDAATPQLHAPSLHDALPICRHGPKAADIVDQTGIAQVFYNDQTLTRGLDNRIIKVDPVILAQRAVDVHRTLDIDRIAGFVMLDRKSTRLNSSHVKSSYAVFC